MHFVYETDNLFQSIRISYGNSSVKKGFHFFELISTLDFVCVQNAPFKATSAIFNPFWLQLLLSCIYWFFEAIRPWNSKAFQMNIENVESWHGIIIFTHIACARKLRGLRQKLDALRVQNGQSLSKYQDFIRKLVCYKGISFFKTYLNS